MEIARGPLGDTLEKLRGDVCQFWAEKTNLNLFLEILSSCVPLS